MNVTVATANEQFGRMIREPGGFDAIQHADVLLLQEALDAPDRTEEYLRCGGFTLAHREPELGLAIAVGMDGPFYPVHASQRTIELSPAISDKGGQRESVFAKRFRARGLIGVKLFNAFYNTEITVATAHPVVPVRFAARAKQIRAMGRALQDSYFAGPLILGGDMNHYPAPRAVDYDVAEAAGMERVDIGSAATWKMEGSNSERLGRVAAFVTRKRLGDFDGQLDALLYRGDGMTVQDASVEEIESDHRAIIATFSIPSMPRSLTGRSDRPQE